MLDTLTKEDWSIHLGEAFALKAENLASMELILAEVTAFGRQRGLNREAYSLLFRGPAQPILRQQIFTLRHSHMGELDIFLVPLGPDAEGMRYEAVFT
jgi:hypothetical protein